MSCFTVDVMAVKYKTMRLNLSSLFLFEGTLLSGLNCVSHLLRTMPLHRCLQEGCQCDSAQGGGVVFSSVCGWWAGCCCMLWSWNANVNIEKRWTRGWWNADKSRQRLAAWLQNKRLRNADVCPVRKKSSEPFKDYKWQKTSSCSPFCGTEVCVSSVPAERCYLVRDTDCIPSISRSLSERSGS